MAYSNKKDLLTRVFSLVLAAAFSLSPFLAPFPTAAAAGVPQVISYQGRLTDASGNLLGGEGTTYYFKFSLWDNPTVGSGSQLWPTTAHAVTSSVRQGVFTVNIGDTANGYPDTLDYPFTTNSTVYLQVQVSSDNVTFETLSPRQQISSAVFAHVAAATVGTAQSSIGTTSPDGNASLTVESTTSSATPLVVRGRAGQTADLVSVKNAFGVSLFSISAAGLASTTSLFTSALTLGTLSGILKATAGVVATALVNLASDVTGVLAESHGGTNQSGYAKGDILYASAIDTLSKLPASSNGLVLKLAGGVPTWATDLTGSGGAGLFASTTDNLAIYPSFPSYVVIIGASATTTGGNILEVAGNSLFRGNVVAYGSITAPVFTATSSLASTFTNASTTNISALGTAYFGTASTTNFLANNATTSALYVTSRTNALLAADQNGQVIASSTIGSNLISGALGTINGTTLARGSSITVAAASSTLLSDNNLFSGANTFTNATTTGFAVTNLSSALLSTNGSGTLIATSTIGSNYITGALGSINGTSLSRGGSITVSAASSTLLSDTNTWSALQFFSNASTTNISASGTGYFATASTTNFTALFATTTNFAITALSNSLLAVNQNGQVIASSTIGANVISGSLGSINGTSFTRGSSITVTAASSTLLANNNTFSGNNIFNGLLTLSNASSTLTTLGTTWFSGISNGILATDETGKVIASSTIGANLISGALGTINGTSFTRGSSITITAASSTLLSNNNTFSGSNMFSGSLTLASATSTAFAITSLSNSLLAVNANGSVIATTSLNINQYLNGTLGVANGGTGAGTFTYGLLLANGTNALAHVATSSLGLLTTDVTEGTNKYYQDSRVQTYLDTLGKGYFFATSSADYWKTANNFFSTTSAAFWDSTVSRWATTSASYFLSQNQGAAFSTTSANYLLTNTDKGFFFATTSADYWKSVTTFTGASTTLLSNNNTFSGTNLFSGNLTLTNATTSSFAITNLANAAGAVLAVNANGSVIATSTIGTNLLSGALGTINGTSFSVGGSITVGSASTTLLSDANTWTKLQILANASSTLTTLGTTWFSGITNGILATDETGKVIASSTIGANYISGALGSINGTSLARGGSITISAASSTLLANNNTFSGNNSFSSTITGSISGNAGTVTNGVYTTDSGSVTNTMLANPSTTVNSQTCTLGSTCTITAASSTLLANNNTFSGSNMFSGTLTLANASSTNISASGIGYFGTASTTNFTALFATTTNFAITALSNSLLAVNQNGQVIASSTIGANLLTGTLGVNHGGTGLSSFASGDLIYANGANSLAALPKDTDGLVLKLVGGFPSWQSDLTSAGSNGLFATTSDSLAIHPATVSNVFLLGQAATTTTGNIFELLGSSLFRGTLTAYNTITAPAFTATSSIVSTFPNASTTNLTAANAWLTGQTASTLLALNENNQLISSSTIGANLISGALGTINGTSFTRGSSITISAASSTLLSNNNTFSGTNLFNGNTTLAAATSSAFAITSLSNSLLAVNANGSVIATSTIGTNLLSGALGTINGTSFSVGGSITVGSASTTLLSDANTWTKLQILANASSTLTTLGTTWFSGITNGILATDETGKVIASSTIGANYISGALGSINGTSLARGGSITISAASSTLLANNNTFSGNNSFSSTITGSISGNAGTVTNGVYTTDSGSVTNTMLANPSTTVNSQTCTLGSTCTITAASSTLLANNNTFSGSNMFSGTLTLANASSTNISASGIGYFGTASTTNFTALFATTTNFAITALSNSLLAVNQNGQVIASSTIGANLLTGTLGVNHGGTGLSSFASGDLIYANGANSLAALPKDTDGLVLKLVGGFPSWQSDLTSAGSNGLFATTSDSLAIHPATVSNVFLLGQAATTTTGNIFELLGSSLFRGTLTAYNTITAPAFTATSSIVSTFPNASTTNLTAANAWLTGQTASTLLALNENNQLISSSTIGANLISGALGTINGTSFTRGSSITISAASSTLLSNNNTFSGTNLFNGNTTLAAATSSAFAITSLSNSLLAVNANGSVIATSTIGTNLLSGALGTINGTSFSVGGSITVGSASTTLLSDANTWTKLQILANASSTLTTLGTTWFSGITNGILATDETGKVIASSTIGANYISGALGSINGTSLARGGSITISAASSTLLANNNTFSGNNSFSSTITGSISGNAGTVTNGVYTTDSGSVTNTMLANPSTTVNSQTCTLGSTCTITAASSTLLANNNTFSGSNMFSGTLTLANASSTNISASGIGYFGTASTTNFTALFATTTNFAITALSNSLLAVNQNGQVIASSTIGANLLTGTLGVNHGGTGLSSFASGDLIYANGANSLAALPKDTDGLVLKLVGGFPSWQSDLTSAGSNGLFATTSDSLAIHPATVSNVFLLGQAATTTTGNIFELLGSSLFRGTLTAYNTITAPAFTATSSIVSTFPNASTTNLTAANAWLTGQTASTLLALNENNQLISSSTIGANLISGALGTINGTSFTRGSSITISAASSTLLSNNNTFSGTNLFNGNTTLAAATSSAFAITSLSNSLLAVNANGSVIATSTIGTNLLSGALGTINGTSFSVGGSITVGSASTTLLSDANTWTKLQILANASSTLTTLGTTWFSGITNGILATDETGKVIASSTIGANYISGALGSINGTSLARGGSITISAASSTLLANNNTFSGNNSFSSTITGSISGNAGTVTNGVYTTDSGSVTNTMLANPSTTVNSQTCTLGSTCTITAASSTLLANNNTFSGSNMFSGTLTLANASSTNISASGIGYFGTASTTNFTALFATTTNFAITALSNSLLAVNQNGQVIASSTIGANLLTGTLGVNHGGTGLSSFASGDLIYANGANSLAALPKDTDGLVLKLVGGFPSWQSDLTSAGSNGLFATTSDSLAIHPATVSNVFLLGQAATTTTGNIFELLGSSLFRGTLTAYNTITAPAFTATSSIVSTFPNASTTNLTAANAWLTGQTASTLLALNENNQLISSSTIGANLISGALGTINGTSFTRGSSITISAASSTLLSNNNTFSGTNLFNGNTTLAAATSSAFAITSLSNSLLAVNANGSVIATTSLNINQYLNGTLGVANGGTGAATFSYGLLLANGTNALAHVATSTLGLLTTDVTEGTNKYYQDSRVQTYLDTLNKGYFFATSSAAYWQGTTNFFSTTSAAFWDSTVSRWATTSASYFLSQNQGAAFSTTSANYLLTNTDKGFFFATTSADYWKSVTTFTGASTTLLSNNNTFSGTNLFSGNLTLTNATTSSFAITNLANAAGAVLAVNANGSVIATSTIGTNLLSGALGTINGTSFSVGGSITVGSASTTLLSDANTWTKLQILANASSTLTTLGTTWFSGITNGILATDETGKVIASSTIGANYISGALGSINGTSLARGGSITISAASSTLLANNNTFSGNNSFSSTITGSISGNAGTVTNGVYTTDSGSVTNTMLANPSTTVNSQTCTLGSTCTITAASSTLLANNNTFSGSNMFSGTLTLANATTSSFAITNLTGALLSTNANGSVIATTSLNINQYLNGTLGVANGGTGAATFSYGLLLANGTNALAHVATSTLGLLTTDVTEGTNKYYQDSRVQTYLDTLNKGYFFATSSAAYWQGTTNFFSTTSASYFSSLGLAFSTTSADYWKSVTTFTGASTTLLLDNNTWSGLQILANASSTLTTLGTTWFSGISNGILATDETGKVIASSTIGANYISGTLGSINGTSLARGGSITISAASSTLLSNTNAWSALQTFAHASTTLGTFTTGYFTNLYGGFASTTEVDATTICLTGDTCRTTWPTAAWPFTTGLSTYGTTTQATTTPFWFKGGLFASSTASIPTLAVTQSGTGAAATFIGGNVGIGTSSPSSLLSIQGISDFSLATSTFYNNLLLASTSRAINFGTAYGAGSNGYGIRENGGMIEFRNAYSSTTPLSSNWTPLSSSANVRYKLNESGWVNTGATLPGNVRQSQLAVIGDYVYLFGGFNAAVSLNIIYRAPISNPTAWVDTGATIPGILAESQVAVIGDYVYLFGGYVSGVPTNVIYRAPISNPTSWSNTGATLPGNLALSQLAVIGDYVYLFGGYNGSASNVIYRAPISNPTSWSDTGATLPGNLYGSQLAVIGDYVYLFGGLDSSWTNVIYRAPISNPTIWNDTGAVIPDNVGYSSVAVIGDYTYLLGGRQNGSPSNIIYRAPNSNPTSWSDTGLTLPGNIAETQAAVIGDYEYLFGGCGASCATNVIYRAPITHNEGQFDVRSWSLRMNAPNGAFFQATSSSSNLSFTSGGINIGTTTNSAGLLQLSTSTAPQLLLGDANNNLWAFRSINNNFYLATSTGSATSSVSALAINQNGLLSFGAASSTILSATTICLTGDTCRTTWPSSSSGIWPFTTGLNAFGTTTQATTTVEWFKMGLFASSTSQFDFASTTALSATTICLTGDSCRTTWPTSGSAWPFTTGLSTYGTTTQATTTPFWFQGGLFASSTASIPTFAVTQSGTGAAATFLGGNVGIGTTSPYALLSLRNTNSSLSNLFTISSSTSAGDINLLTFNNLGQLTLGSTASSTVGFAQLSVLAASTTLKRVSSNTLAHIGNDIYVQGRYAYIVDSGTTNSFEIWDISDPASAIQISSATLSELGFQIFVKGHFAYITTFHFFQIWDVSNPAKPILYSNNKVAQGPADITVEGKYAYLAETGKFEVWDISDPVSPLQLASATIAAFQGSGTEFTLGTYVYVVNGSGGLFILDVSNPSNPTVVSNTAVTTGFGDDIYVQGRYAYITSDAGSNNSLQIFDVSNPTAPSSVSISSLNTVGAGERIFVQGRYAYISDQTTTNGFEMWDVSNPSSPVRVVSNTLNAVGGGAIFVQGRYAYLIDAGGASNGFEIWDLGGAYVQQLEAGGIEAGTLSLRNDLYAFNGAFYGGLNVGQSLNVTGGGNFQSFATTSLALAPTLSSTIIDSNSSSIVDALMISHMASSSAPSAGIGTGLLFEDNILCSLSNCTYATSTATSTARIASVLTNVSNTSPQSDLAFFTKSSSAGLTERMRLTSQGLLGIGTSTPLWALTVASSSGPQLALTSTGNSFWTMREINGNFYLASSSGATSATSSISAFSINTNGLTTLQSATTSLFFGAGLTVCQSGNVLTYDGAGHFGCAADATGGGGAWPFVPSTYNGVANQSTTTPFWLQNTMILASTTLFTNASTTGFTVAGNTWFPSGIWNSSGNVGFGTTSPSTNFEIGDSSASGVHEYITNSNTGTAAIAELALRNDYTAGQGMRMLALGTNYTSLGAFQQDGGVVAAGSPLSGGLSIGAFASAPLRFYTGGSGDVNERMRITSTGNVGIGTTSPQRLLQVEGSSNPAIVLNASGLEDFDMAQITTSGAFLTDAVAGDTVFRAKGGKLLFGSNSTGPRSTLSITAGNPGNVGIGSTTPWKTLSVVGDAYFTGTATTTALTATTICLTGDTCRTTWPTGSSAWPWTVTTSIFGTTTNATTTETWYKTGLIASSTSQLQNLNVWNQLTLESTSSAILSTDTAGNVVATTSVGANFITGALGTINGTTFSRGDTITVASTTLLANNNTFSGNNIFSGTLTLANGTSTAFAITSLANAAGALLAVNPNGSVIGTSSISASLLNGTLAVLHGGTGLATFGGTNTILFTSSADTLSSNSSFTFTGTNLGVGTSSPWAKLAVSANNGETNTMLFQIASSTASATTSLFSVDNTGLTTIGDSSGTGNAVFQFAGDVNAWTVGYLSSDKSFDISSSTNLSGTAALSIAKNGTLTLVGPGGTCVANGSATGGALACTSDARLKTNIITMSGSEALAKLARIKGVTYTWTDPALDQSERVGVIAQDVQLAFPELVGSTTVNFEGTPGEYLTVNYAGLTAPLIAAVNDLNAVYNAASATTSAPSILSLYQGTSSPALTIGLDGSLGIGTTTATSTTNVKLCLNGSCVTSFPYASSATSSATSTPTWNQSFLNALMSEIGKWLASAANGIGDLFANRVHTKELCVAKSDGTEVCVNGDQLANLLSGSTGSPQTGGGSSASTGGASSSTSTTSGSGTATSTDTSTISTTDTTSGSSTSTTVDTTSSSSTDSTSTAPPDTSTSGSTTDTLQTSSNTPLAPSSDTTSTASTDTPATDTSTPGATP